MVVVIFGSVVGKPTDAEVNHRTIEGIQLTVTFLLQLYTYSCYWLQSIVDKLSFKMAINPPGLTHPNTEVKKILCTQIIQANDTSVPLTPMSLTFISLVMQQRTALYS